MQSLQDKATLQCGKYKIISTLGQGGFGITYLAEQVMLGRKVALKEFYMKDLCNRDEETSQVSVGSAGSIETVQRFKEKFLKEARLIAAMDNSHIVRIHDIFEENGTAYYVMEYIDGEPLDSLIKKGQFSTADAVNLIVEVGTALIYIHQMNILHLDIKPSNILLRSSGEPVLIDFGISKRYDEGGGQTSTTPVGISKGYAPIEQYNQSIQNFSPATDVYSLGATLFKVLTGITPPEAPMLLEEDFPDCPQNVPAFIWNAVQRAMEPIKKKRYQSVNDFLAAISIVNNQLETEIIIPKQQCVLPLVQEDTLFIKKSINYNGHSYVDLGLSVKWATSNLGTDSEYQIGNLFTFAATENTNEVPSIISGNNQYDHCRRLWGGDWRMPTKEEQDELRMKCKWEYLASKYCYKVTGPSGNSIILPDIASLAQSSMKKDQVNGYWSGNLHVINKQTAYYIHLDFSHKLICWMNEMINKKMAIRGVIE